MKLSNIPYFVKNPKEALIVLLNKWAFLFPDKMFLKMKFRLRVGYKLNLKNPVRFNEKLQWLKLYDRNPEYTKMVDKVAAKDYVREKIGDKYIIPTLGVYNSVEEINWDELPNRFVLKCAHDSGGIVICKDKTTLNIKAAKEKLKKGLSRSYFYQNREWPYKNVPRRIIAEKFITNGYDDDLTDFKFYCFDGEPRYCQVIADRNTKETIDFFDMDWVHQDFCGLNPVCGPAAKPAAKPQGFETMKRIARELAKDTQFVRVDMYAVNETTYFGELTFYPASGMGVFTPDSANFDLGALLTLKGENRGGYKALISSDLHIERISSGLKDYKFYCFDGVPRICKVDFGRYTEEGHKANFYDMDWKLLDIELSCYPSDKSHIELKPQNFDKMVELATKLSKGHRFLRVDLYNLNGELQFGELTFFPDSGICKFIPEKWDENLGELLSLKLISGGG
jgi:hypothetical protein